MARHNDATEGDKVVEVKCRCGTVLVQPGRVVDWRCRCHRKELGRTLTLGPRGAVPR